MFALKPHPQPSGDPFFVKRKIAPLLNTRKPVIEAVKLSIGYLVAPQTEFAEYHYLIYGSYYLE
jgi:hypothetical protein